MGIQRENGYSATVEGYLVVGDCKFQLAKTNGVDFVLAESCTFPPGTKAALLITVDGTTTRKPIILLDGIVQNQVCVPYQDDVPF